MKRTPLKKRALPDYTKGEEIFNMVSHIVGGGLGIVALALTVIKSIIYLDGYAIVGSAIYGISLVLMYTMSGIYHGLKPNLAKKVMQVMDHCAIYILIAGTYTPVLLVSIRKVCPLCCWTLFAIIWGLAVFATTLTAIDIKKYNILSMICYIGMGWSIIFAAKTAVTAMGTIGFGWMLAGGIAYSIGAVLYGLGKRKKYMHSIFHLFVILGSILQFISIFFYIL